MTSVDFNYAVLNEKQSLKNFALSLTHDKEDAEDLVQDTYLKAIKYKEKYTDETNLKAWLFTIMKNTFINNYRRLQKSRQIMAENADFAMLKSFSKVSSFDSESALNAKEIINAIDSLDEQYKRPFARYYNGYKYQEIAEEMHLPIGTIKSRIFIARKMLMGKLKDFRRK
jgi:RNA polymerase sigma-70 factor (ECF subfamily)